MRITNTIPQWKMPDDEKIPHNHTVLMRLWAELVIQEDYYAEWILDLTEYYDWTKENNMEIEHNMLILGEDRVRSSIMFTFWTATDAMAFKLRWK